MARLQYFFDVLIDTARISDPRMDLFLMRSPLQIITILGLYLGIIYKFGPAFMKKREPYSLRRIIICYNLVQIVANTALFAAVVQHWDYLDLLCTPQEFPNNDICTPKAHHVHYFYVLLKYLDLIETFFFVLRKKNRQISFLHVYHHCGTLIVAWISGKYFPGGQAFFVVLYNTFIHAIMYSYYLYTSISSNNNSIWWKKYVTILQMVQQLLIFVCIIPVVFNKNCWYPKYPMLAFAPNVLALGFLFMNFYRKNYIKKKEE